jgi:nicotinate-nucleotide adenylyltransferase
VRVAFYGGSFNPPHVGHAMVASWLCWTDRVDQVWLVPVAHHAFGKALAPFSRRRAWCEAMAADLGERVRVEPIEASLPPPSYSIRTLEALSERHPEAVLRLVIGADALPGLPLWHRSEEIQARFSPIVVGRDGHEVPQGTPVFPDISSTNVRRAMVEGEPVDALVPASVLARITASDVRGWESGA